MPNDSRALLVLDGLLGRFARWRRWRGGFWVCWLTPYFDERWLHDAVERPEWARGSPTVEDYDWEEIMSMTDEEVEAELRADGIDLDAARAKLRAFFEAEVARLRGARETPDAE